MRFFHKAKEAVQVTMLLKILYAHVPENVQSAHWLILFFLSLKKRPVLCSKAFFLSGFGSSNNLHVFIYNVFCLRKQIVLKHGPMIPLP